MLEENYRLSFTLLTIIVLLGLNGCVTPPREAPRMPSAATSIPEGSYHRVAKGETLWRISRMYGVELEELVKLNRIPDGSSIEAGQQILLPRTQRPFTGVYGEDFIWPLKGNIIGSFGRMYNNMINKGIDIQADEDSDIMAARGGKVIFISDNFLNLGKTIIIDHGDSFSTLYARNSQILVKPGDIIERGSVIAKIGYAGRSKNAYLHFQIRKGHLPQNPVYYLPR